MGVTTMKTFWSSRWAGWSSDESRSLLLWDLLRAVVFIGFFVAGCAAHDALVVKEGASGSMRFVAAIATFGTFLAAFVMTLMTAVGKRELDLMRDAVSVRRMENRLRWLMSDQLIMVVTALAAAGWSLVWLGLYAVMGEPWRVVSAFVLAFAALALLNALRLPFQIWEVQSSALAEERERAYKRLNDENDSRFKTD